MITLPTKRLVATVCGHREGASAMSMVRARDGAETGGEALRWISG